jgi:hypothetical protein
VLFSLSPLIFSCVNAIMLSTCVMELLGNKRTFTTDTRG